MSSISIHYIFQLIYFILLTVAVIKNSLTGVIMIGFFLLLSELRVIDERLREKNEEDE